MLTTTKIDMSCCTLKMSTLHKNGQRKDETFNQTSSEDSKIVEYAVNGK